MDRHVEDKLDKVADDISQINVTLAKQEVSLSDHIRRTQLLEDKVIPLEKHVLMFNAVLKFIGVVALFVGIIEGLLRIFVG